MIEEFKNVSNNIRKHRKRKNLTQAQLAEYLCVTSQNVSKWEKGLSLPDISNLWKLAQFFAIPLEEFLGVSQAAKQNRALIAIDGGGTKTEFILFETDGKIIKREVLGGSNINSLGVQNAFSVLKSGIDSLMFEGYEIIAIYAGIAGCGIEDNRKKILSFLKKNYSDINIDVRSDLTNVMNSNYDSQKMIAVICGTGSVVCAKTPTSTHRVGGWGYAFDSGGSGYDFGRDAICAALAQRDGVGDETVITELVEERLNGIATDKISHIYANGKDYIASFAGTVFEAYHKGDKVAAEIVERNINRIYYIIKRAYEMYDCGNTVVISGGLVYQKDVLKAELQKINDQNLQFIFNEVPPIVGAAVCCVKNLKGESNNIPEFRKSFIESYDKIRK